MRSAGFSLIELTIGIALTLAVAAAVFSLTDASRRVAAVQAEAADVQQRARVAAEALTHDLMAAGAGSYLPAYAGPLNAFIPSVMPFRRGMTSADPPGTFRSDVITLLHVPATAAQTTLSGNIGVGSITLPVARLPGCAAGVNLCSFAPGMTLLLFDASGAFQVATVAAVLDAALQLTTTVPAAFVFAAGAAVVEVEPRTYFLKPDPSTGSTQLMRDDGATNGDVPVLDHITALSFEYGLNPAELVDGPWRPNATSADRWDVDLLRIRGVDITVRIEAALAAMRGPAGLLFTNGGTATSARSWVPDQEVRFHVSPPNLGLRR